MTDIRKTSKDKDVEILRMGQTENGSFGSSPSVRVKGGRPTRDITIPTTKG